MTRTETLRERRLKKQQQIRQLQAQIDDIDAQIVQASAKERLTERRQWRDHTFTPIGRDYMPTIFDPTREVVSEGCGEARVVTA